MISNSGLRQAGTPIRPGQQKVSIVSCVGPPPPPSLETPSSTGCRHGNEGGAPGAVRWRSVGSRAPDAKFGKRFVAFYWAAQPKRPVLRQIPFSISMFHLAIREEQNELALVVETMRKCGAYPPPISRTLHYSLSQSPAISNSLSMTYCPILAHLAALLLRCIRS